MEALIEKMKKDGSLKTMRVEEAVRSVPRHFFVSEQSLKSAYRDVPLPIGLDQTISQPSTVVAMTEALDVQLGHKVLEIGAGSGWQAAILGKLVGSNGLVFSVERLVALIDTAKGNIAKTGMKNVHIVLGDGSKGLQHQAPYDRIIVTAACPDVPEPLKDQLKMGGKMIIPVGDHYTQEMQLITKVGEKSIDRKSLGTFRFVPLIGEYGFKKP